MAAQTRRVARGAAAETQAVAAARAIPDACGQARALLIAAGMTLYDRLWEPLAVLAAAVTLVASCW